MSWSVAIWVVCLECLTVFCGLSVVGSCFEVFVISGRGKKDSPLVGLGSKLRPFYLQDSLGSHIIITCGNISGSLYLSKLDESKKPQPKCKWLFSPPEFESFAGGKAKKWKQSLHHLGKPLSDYFIRAYLLLHNLLLLLVF